MGQGNTTDMQKSYHSLPQLVQDFHNNSADDSIEYNKQVRITIIYATL